MTPNTRAASSAVPSGSSGASGASSWSRPARRRTTKLGLLGRVSPEGQAPHRLQDVVGETGHTDTRLVGEKDEPASPLLQPREHELESGALLLPADKRLLLRPMMSMIAAKAAFGKDLRHRLVGSRTIDSRANSEVAIEGTSTNRVLTKSMAKLRHRQLDRIRASTASGGAPPPRL